MGNINERDYKTYRKVFDLITLNLPNPSLLIYLKAPVDTLVQRIQARGRDIESTISRDYLALLDSFYADWIGNFDLCPVLTLRTDDLDFVHEPRHLDTVVRKIKDKLSGREEIVFD